MFENISKKQEKVQEKIQKQQERNDKDCRELTDEELDQIVGGMKAVHVVQTAQLVTMQVADAVSGVVVMPGKRDAVAMAVATQAALK